MYLHSTANSRGKVELRMKMVSLIYLLLFQNSLRKQGRIWSSGLQGTKYWSCLRILETPLSHLVIDIFTSRVNWINFQLGLLEKTSDTAKEYVKNYRGQWKKNSSQRKRFSYFLTRKTVTKMNVLRQIFQINLKNSFSC